MSFKFEIPEDITLDEKTLEKYKGKTLDEINDILKEEKELKRKELKKKQSERKISINYFETWSLHNINNITYKNKYWILYGINNRIRYIEKELGTIKEIPKLNINKIFKDNFKNIKLED